MALHFQITSLDGIVFPPGLTSLDLSNNKITSFAGMQFPLSLLSLNLAGNPIDVRTVTELKNPSPFVIREIVAAFPETAQHFKRTEGSHTPAKICQEQVKKSIK
jgi:hypothetical protein